VLTDGQPRSAEMTDRILTAWGPEPFDYFAVTETGGGLALDCQAHDGRHVFEDTSIVEVADADDQPVPDGHRGHHLLITNLFNRTQAFIRYRLSDMTAYQPSTCSCGLAFQRLEPIDGRHDDILELPARTGTTVALRPTAFASLFALDGVAELEVDALASNNGHLLWSGIVEKSKAKAVARHPARPATILRLGRAHTGRGPRSL
jgi:hypothetical protein